MNADEYSSQNEFPDELISAYLDGELTDEEKARVEEQLMDCAEHRRLFEELKTLRSSLQELPRQSLDGDFAQRVLRRAERELLTGENAESAQAPSESPRPRTKSPASDDAGTWRGLVWSAAALAAAIGLIIFSPMLSQEGRQNSVAVNDASQGVNQQVQEDESGSVTDKRSQSGANGSVGEQLSRTEAAVEQAEAGGAKWNKGGDVLAGQDRDGGSTSRPQVSGPSGDAPNVASVASANSQGNEGERSESRVEKSLRLENEKIAANARQASSSANGGTAGREELGMRDLNDADAAAWMQLQKKGALAEAYGQADYSDGLLVVGVDMTPDALSGHFMEKMLKKHKIHVELAKAELNAANKAAVDGVGLLQQQVGGQGATSGRTDAKDRSVKQEGGDLRAKEARRRGRQLPQQGEQLLYVVASADQVDRLIGDLQQQSESVVALAYDGAGGQLANRTADDQEVLRGRAFRRLVPSQPKRSEATNRESVPPGAGVAADERQEITSADKAQKLSPELTPESNEGSGLKRKEADRTTTRSTKKPNEPATGFGGGSAGGAGDGTRPQNAFKANQSGQSANSGAGAPPPANFHLEGGGEVAKNVRSSGEGASDGAVDAQRKSEERFKDSEAFRGIARRLHLPENLVQRLKQPTEVSREGLRAAFAESTTSDPRGKQGQAQTTQEHRNNALDQQIGSRVGKSKADESVVKYAHELKGRSTPVRVLFVLRSVSPPVAGQLPAGNSIDAAASQAPIDE